eukprot:UN00081
MTFHFFSAGKGAKIAQHGFFEIVIHNSNNNNNNNKSITIDNNNNNNNNNMDKLQNDLNYSIQQIESEIQELQLSIAPDIDDSDITAATTTIRPDDLKQNNNNNNNNNSGNNNNNNNNNNNSTINEQLMLLVDVTLNSDITEEEIIYAISQAKTYKSAGIDCILVEALKACLEYSFFDNYLEILQLGEDQYEDSTNLNIINTYT